MVLLVRTFGPVSGYWCSDDRIPYLDDDNADDWDFADVPIDSFVSFQGNIREKFEAICEDCRPANVAILQDAN